MSELAAAAADISQVLPCLGCGLWVSGRDDYCAACWDDVLDWLGW
jgi:hypothetical protein